MSETTLTDETPEVDPTAVLDEIENSIDEVDGPSCEKCGFATNAAACPKCGWYPVLGIHVEIDEAFEAVMTAPSAEAAEEASEVDASKPEWQKHLEVWSGLIPMWAWLMIGTTLAAVGAGIGVRLATSGSPALHMYCGIGGLLIGSSIAAIAHLIGFILCSSEDASFGVVDILIKPFKTWKKLAEKLPNRVWLANSMNLGLSTVLASVLIVGGIPYEKLLDWGFKARAKKTFVAMIAEKAASVPGEGKDNLEDAIGDFAGKAGDVDAPPPKPVAPKPRQRLECLVMGYQTDSNGKLVALLLAADQRGKLKYVGRVKPNLPKREATQLVARFRENGSTRPLVRTPESGTWLRPKFMCRATYTEWPDNKRPKDLEWGELMDEVKIGW